MASKHTPNTTPFVPSPSEKGLQREENSLDGHVTFALKTACGHTVERATVNQLWLDTHPAIERELMTSLDKGCSPLPHEPRCGQCPFAGREGIHLV